MNLSEYIQAHLNKPFEWGVNDCITFSIGWLEHKTGRDYLTEHRPWRSAIEAHKKLRDLGGLFFLLSKDLDRVHPNMAQDGDISIYQDAGHLFSGRHIVSVGKSGLVVADRTLAEKAWKCR